MELSTKVIRSVSQQTFILRGLYARFKTKRDGTVISELKEYVY